MITMGLRGVGLVLLLGLMWNIADASILDPKGPIAAQEKELLFITVAIMLIVLVPVYVLAVWFGRVYRATNQSARYRPNWGSSKAIEVLIWFVPASIIAVLGTFVWHSTHQLDPCLKVQASE